MSQVPHETINVANAEIGIGSLPTLLYPHRSHLPRLSKR